MTRRTGLSSRHRRAAAATALLTLLTACQAGSEQAYDVAQPRTATVRNIGNFNEALRCMDDMFLAQGKRDIFITTAGIPDLTGLLPMGTKDMFITAVSRMSARSGAFRYVDYDTTQSEVQIMSEAIGPGAIVAPSYYVRGAITQLDSNVLQSQASAGVSIPFMDLAVNGNKVASVVSMDLNIGEVASRQILAGMSASNSIAVIQSGKGADVGGLIGKAGLSLSVSIDKSEGFHQAVRNLIELSTIEVLGKLTHVPYWQCLSIDSTNPNFRAEARGWFDTMAERDRDTFVNASLVRTGYLQSPSNGAGTEFFDAVARYQADNDLVPNGRVDFDLYYRMLANEARQPNEAGRVVATPAAAGAPVQSTPAGPPRLVLSSSRGPRPKYRAGETLVVSVEPTQDAYVYCYYQDAAGTVARIFPNRNQPNPLLHAGVRTEVPPDGTDDFVIRFDKPGVNEAVACLGSEHEIGLSLPNDLKVQDLQPLPVSGLDDLAARFRAIPGERVSEARLAVQVIQ